MRLTDCFAELMAYVAYFLRNKNQNSLSCGQVQADIQRLLAESEEVMRQERIPADDYNEARFAICAWGDEAILRSQWEGRTQWQKEPLQRLYFQTTDAGKEFFERLNKLGPQQKEAREIFYLCLAMGFKGQYHQEGDAMLLEQLKTSNLKFLLGSSIGLPPLDRGELFPEAYPAETGDSFSSPKKRFLDPMTLAIFVSPLILFGTLFLIYSFILSNIGKTFLGTVH